MRKAWYKWISASHRLRNRQSQMLSHCKTFVVEEAQSTWPGLGPACLAFSIAHKKPQVTPSLPILENSKVTERLQNL